MPKIRLNKALKEFNISTTRLVEFLKTRGFEVEPNPNAQLDEAAYAALEGEFAKDSAARKASHEAVISKAPEEKPAPPKPEIIRAKATTRPEAKILGKVDLEPKKPAEAPVAEEKPTPAAPVEKPAAEAPAPVAETPKPVEIPKAPEAPAKAPEPIVETPKPTAETPVEPTPTADTSATEVPAGDAKQGFKVLDKIDVSGYAPARSRGKKAEKPAPAKPKPAAKADAPAPAAQPQTKTPAAKTPAPPAAPVAPVVPAPAAEATPPAAEPAKPEEPQKIQTAYQKLDGPKIVGEKVDLSQFNRSSDKKKKRKRIEKPTPGGNATGGGNNQNRPVQGGQNARPGQGGNNRPGQQGGNRNQNQKGPGRRNAPAAPVELTDEQVKNQIRETLEKLTNKGGKSKGSKHRRDKRSFRREQDERQQEMDAMDTTLKVTEFITVGELASLMNVAPTEVISTAFSLGVMVTMNQRLEADILTLVADEFGYTVEFSDADLEEEIEDDTDAADDLQKRAPIVTVMGHVDHGKTSLLDYIRKTNVIAGESGGITQHIGAYNVQLENGEHITFLDTPGHEAFTAMRARGAQVTDIAIIVIAADDDVMPQTKEAIAHAQAAGVPMIIALNKVDKPTANPDNVRQQLSGMNVLVEEWGGNIQSQEISAKFGTNVPELLDKVLLQAELLDLKANPDRIATGTVIEASLDKGRGYVSTILVQNGTLRVGDYVLAGKNHGKVKAMLDERGKNMKEAGPSVPVTILGLDGAPTAGDKFRMYQDEAEAKSIAAKREQLQREMSVRTKKHTTLEELGRRIALGEFKELNIILKGDVDGSVEALSDQLQRLSTEEINVNILHSGVGQITESDVNLATASDAIIIGFNVRAGGNAKELADREEIEIRTYSVIYKAIEEVKEAMEGMLSPEMVEEVIGNVEIREVFKISKVGTIAGCMVLSGKVTRNSSVRLLREGIVKFDGQLESLKRFKDDVREVTKGYECGISLKGYNDLEQYDQLEVYEEVAVKKKLK